MRVVYGKACSYLTMNAKVTRVMMRLDYNIKIILGSIVNTVGRVYVTFLKRQIFRLL